MKKIVIILLFWVGLSQLLNAQVSVNGTVVDENGKAVSGATISVRNGASVKTDENGKFSVSMPNRTSGFVISGEGIQTLTTLLRPDGIYTVKSNNKTEDEVIVVAYGTAKKATFSGSANVVSNESFKDRPLSGVTNALIGSTPGLATVTANGQPGSAPAVRIRGFGSINASNEPLYVVDGVPYVSNLANLNMDDVESLTVLKDAATTSLYGARAANGVIMITTKKGKKNKNKNNITFKYNLALTSRAIQDYDRVSAEEYMPLMWEAQRNSLAYTAGTPLATANNIASGLVTGQNGIINLLGYNAFNLPNNQVMLPTGKLNPAAQLIFKREDLDWFSPITRNGIRNEYSLNYSGGSDNTDYFISGSYLKENGYILRSDFERYSVRLNVNSQLKKWFKVGFNVGYTNSGGNFASTSGSNSIVNPFFFAARMGPIYPVWQYDPANPGQYYLVNGKRIYDYGNSFFPGLPTRPAGAYAGRHTIAENLYSKEFFRRNFLNGRTYAEVKIANGLKFTTNVGTDITTRLDHVYQNRLIGDGAPAGRASKEFILVNTITANQILNYTKSFNKAHNFDVLAGHESYKYNDNFLTGTRQGQIVDNNIEFPNFTTTTNLNSSEDNQRVESYFGQAKYDYKNKYLLSASLRRDGNSRFSPKFRWGNFWSASVGYVLSNEGFLKGNKAINYLKLRSSYGTTGNDAGISFYGYQTLYTLGRNNGLTPGIFAANVLGNDSLGWEKNKQFDVGVDFTILKNRLSGSVEYFKRTSDDLLFNVPLPLSSGFGGILKNIGSMFNSGIEVKLDGTVLKSNNFSWNLGFNATKLKNQVTKLPQNEIISGTKKWQAGQSIQQFWLREWYGVDPVDGAALFRAANTSGAGVRIKGTDTVTTSVNNAKFNYVGSAIPDWYGGLTTSFKYKNVTLSALAQWQVGGLTYDDTYAAYMHSGNYGASLHKDMLKRWQNPGDVTTVPRMDNAQTTIFGAVSSRWLTDASFLNIQNVTLSYDLANINIARKINFSNARFYISAENVYMFTKRKGMNPGQSFAGVTSIDYIPARIMNVGFNVNF